MAIQTLNLTHRLYQYLLSVSLREPDILKELRVETAKLPLGKMQISPDQGQFMGFLVELLRPKKILEIGVFTGYSSLVVAMASPSDAKMIVCDVHEGWTSIAKKYWEMAGVSEKITLYLAPAVETLEKLLIENQENSFDFAFIDADKKLYDVYYEKTLKLMRPGGLILLDNVLRHGHVADPKINDQATEAIRQLNKKIHQDPRVSISMIPIGDGLTLMHKR